jgi:hypothetical protein
MSRVEDGLLRMQEVRRWPRQGGQEQRRRMRQIRGRCKRDAAAAAVIVAAAAWEAVSFPTAAAERLPVALHP